MPKTTDANSEKSTAALKWESSRVIRLFRSQFLSDRDMVGIGNTDEIQKSRDDQEFGSVIRRRVRDCAVPPVLHAGHNVKTTRAYIAHEAQNIQNIAAIRMVHAALHEKAENKHGGDRGHEQQASNPALLDQMASAGDQPSDGWRDHRHVRRSRGRQS